MDATGESIDHILRLASYKNSGNCKALIVTGCMAQRYKEDIFRELPEVDAVVGTTGFHHIHTIIQDVFSGRHQVACLSDKNTPTPEDLFLLRKLKGPGHFAYLKIAEGCDKCCTYCTIPSIRGRYRSRTLESLLAEAAILADKGVKEIILVAQDTALYGIDIYGESRLHTLLQELSKIENIKWIRILYAYPEHISPLTIKEIAHNPKVVPYLDMPIQHNSDHILKKMGRNMTRAKLQAIISNLRHHIPNLILRTTVIVGFPGETVEDFNLLLAFLQDMAFDRLGVFAYSPEEGTPAASFNNQIPHHIKEERKTRVMALQEAISKEKLRNKVGQTLEVLVEKEEGHNSYLGRTYMDCHEIDGYVSFSGHNINIGDMLKLKITHSLDHDLVGQLL